MKHASKLHKSAFHKTLDARWDVSLDSPSPRHNAGTPTNPSLRAVSTSERTTPGHHEARHSMGLVSHLSAGLQIACNPHGTMPNIARSNDPVLQALEEALGMLQCAEKALEEISALIDRMRSLALLASSSDFDFDRAGLVEEFLCLRAEVVMITTFTEFHGQKVLDAPSSATLSLLAARDSLILAQPEDTGLRRMTRAASRDARNRANAHPSLTGCCLDTSPEAEFSVQALTTELARGLSERKSLAAVHDRLQLLADERRGASPQKAAPRSIASNAQPEPGIRPSCPPSETRSLLGLGTELVVPKAG